MEGNSERLLVSAKGSQKLFSPCLPVLTTSLFSAMEAVHKPYFQITSGFFAFLLSFGNIYHFRVSKSVLISSVAYPSPSCWVPGWSPGCPVLCTVIAPSVKAPLEPSAPFLWYFFLVPISCVHWLYSFCILILCFILFLHLTMAKGWEK